MFFILHFYDTLVSKTAAILKIVYSLYIYRECNVLVLKKHITYQFFFTKL